MRMIQFARAMLGGLALLAAAALSPASAQSDPAANYPNRPIRVVIPFAAGGGNDLFARLVGQKLSENIGQPVIIENKPGAGGRKEQRGDRSGDRGSELHCVLPVSCAMA